MFRNREEDNLQKSIVAFVRNETNLSYGLFYSVPNEAKRTPQTASKMLAMGLLAGVPDLVLHWKARTYFFELKAKNGVVSGKQKIVHENLTHNGFAVYVVRDLDDFKYIFNKITDIRPLTRIFEKKTKY